MPIGHSNILFGEMSIQIIAHFKLDCDIIIDLKEFASYLQISIR